MYFKYNYVYGVIITEEVDEAFRAEEKRLQEHDKDHGTNLFAEFPGSLSEDDHGWFTTFYSGCHDHEVGYIGIEVMQWDQCSSHPKRSILAAAEEQITDEQKQIVQEKIDSLPEWLKAALDTVDFVVCESTS